MNHFISSTVSKVSRVAVVVREERAMSRRYRASVKNVNEVFRAAGGDFEAPEVKEAFVAHLETVDAYMTRSRIGKFSCQAGMQLVDVLLQAH